jgi:hypothetical protein
MKTKHFLNLLTIVAIVAASCQGKEEYLDRETTATAEVVSVQLSPALPGGARLLSSGDGGAGTLDGNDYALRYILEVYNGGTLVPDSREVKVATSFTSPVTFNVTLPAKAYTFVFWADFVDKTDANNNALTPENISDVTYDTKTNGLTAIDWVATSYAIGIDERDAYYAAALIDLSDGDVKDDDGKVTLHRPFAKIRALDKDVQAKIGDGTIKNNGADLVAKLTYKHTASPVFSKRFNALTGTPDASNNTIAAPAELTCTPVKQAGVTTVDGTNYTDAWLLAFDYFLVPSALTQISADIELFDDGTSLGSRELPLASVAPNKLITYMGSVFATFQATMQVGIDDEFDKLEVDGSLVSNLAATAGDYQIAVDCNQRPWTAEVNAAGAGWCTLTNASGTGDGYVTVNVTATAAPAPRAATVTISSGAITREVAVGQQAGFTGTANLCVQCLWDGTTWVDGYVTGPYTGLTLFGGTTNISAYVSAATSSYNGRANTAAMIAANVASDGSAIKICESLGEGWYLPASEELFNMSDWGPFESYQSSYGLSLLNGLSGAGKLTGDAFNLSSTEFFGNDSRAGNPNWDGSFTSTDVADKNKVIRVHKGGTGSGGEKSWGTAAFFVWRP